MKENNDKLNEFVNYIRGKKVAIIGIGVSNVPAVDYLIELGAKITVFDNKTIDKIDVEIIDKLDKNNIKYFLDKDSLLNLKEFDIIFRSPSCRPDLPEIVKELEKGAILTSEIELVLDLCPGTIIGVTGSDGKTTTSSLIYEIIKQKGYNCYLGGNIGTPLFNKIPEMTKNDIIVLELSSFQLMTAKTSPQIAVITNISPNHLDIHLDYEEYTNAKKNIFEYQNDSNLLVINYDNEITYKFQIEAKAKVLLFGKKNKVANGYMLDGDYIKLCENKIRKPILNTKELILKGEHNFENICAALCATKNLVDLDTALIAIKKFKGVEHRLEFVKEKYGVKWYNDSIGTSPTRTIAGLYSFDERLILIAGGYDKNLDYESIAKPIVEKVKTLILTGPTSIKIKESVKKELDLQNKFVDIYECENLEEAVKLANKLSKAKDVVLLSPASASFDAFKNFEERGNKFKELVNNL